MVTQILSDGWSYRRPSGPFAAVQNPGEAIAVPVRLPHDAQRDVARAADAPGRGSSAFFPNTAFTYLRTLDVPADWAGRVVRLELQGAYRRAQVFVNDDLAGNRADGYARFFVDITGFLRYGEPNEVRIEVRAGEDSRWYSGCGLHRPVILHVDDAVHVVPDGVRVTTRAIEADRALLEIATTIANAGMTLGSQVVVSRVLDPDGETVWADETPVSVPPGDTVLVRQRVVVPTPALWVPEHPSLYAAVVGLAPADQVTGDAVFGGGGGSIDAREVRFGIRTVSVDPEKGLRINGETVLLRGACIHHDNGPLGAAAFDRAEERRVEKLKAAGFNAIRSAHNPASKAMLDACDRLGMLVMDEAFDMWVRAKSPLDYAFEFPQWWAADVEAMVEKDYNHPSVIMYSIGNEIADIGTPHGNRLGRALAEKVRELDSTRPVTNCVNLALPILDELPAIIQSQHINANMGDAIAALTSGPSLKRRTLEAYSVVDVVGLNYAESTYEHEEPRFSRSVVVGAETFPTTIGSGWPLVETLPHVIGDFTWTGWDYLGEVGIGATAYSGDQGANRGHEQGYPWLAAWCGDIDITGWRRPASYYREIVFGLRTEPYIAVRRPERNGQEVIAQSPWAWSDAISSWTWPGFEGELVVVEVYADADEIALVLDGVEVTRGVVGAPGPEGTIREGADLGHSERPYQATLVTEYRPGELVAIALRDGSEIGRTTLRTAGTPELAVTPDRTTVTHGPGDLAYVDIELRDVHGTLHTGTDREVTVQVSGAGELAGTCSANPRTAERFASPTWTTFDGRALAVVRPTETGIVEVTVTAAGLEPARATVTVI